MMGKVWVAGCAALGIAVASTGSALAAERFEDARGDAIGDAPDIVAIEVDEPEGSVLRFSVLFASEPPLAADETGSDILWLALDTEPEVDFPELDGYSFMTLAGLLPRDLEMGGHLLAGDDLYWHVVDVAVDGPAVTFRVDRKLLGDPTELWFRVYSAALTGTLYTEQTDVYPVDEEPPARYRLSREQD